MRVGRPRKQAGHLYKKSGSWLGRYRIYDRRGKGVKKCMRLGALAEMTRKEAAENLARLIHADEQQSSAIHKVSARSMIMPRSSTRLQDSDRVRPATRGAVSELLATVDLCNKGYTVYRPVDPGAPCDLLAMATDWTVLRVEVKTAKRLKDGRVLCDLRRQVGCFDLIAFVFPDGRIAYRKPSEITDLLFPLRVDSLHTDSIFQSGRAEKEGSGAL